MRYFEDVEVGETAEFGEYHVTEAEIVEFAEQYDPQPFHVDAEAAEDSLFGELVASGWHTASMCMRMLVDKPGEDRALLGSPGVDELRWKQPVKPGDTLRLRTEVLDTWPSESDPGRGYVRTRLEGLNQDEEVVIRWIANGMWKRRNSGE